jgi:hypothetical protein
MAAGLTEASPAEANSKTGLSPLRPLRLLPIARDELVTRFVRGRASPRGVVWFGVRSFWGHLRHFLAAAIATEDIDSRDWMNPDQPRELCESFPQINCWIMRGPKLSHGRSSRLNPLNQNGKC